MDVKLLRRSRAGLEARIITTGIVALAIGMMATIMFSILFGWTRYQGWFSISITWVVLFLGWVYTALKLKMKWDKIRYEISPDAIILYEKAGKFGGSKTIYRYESIISVRMTQDYLGKKYGYGNVHINIPKLDKEIVLKDVDHPNEQLAALQANIKTRDNAAATQSLIS